MSPMTDAEAIARAGAPRVSGDEPSSRGVMRVPWMCSPRERG